MKRVDGILSKYGYNETMLIPIMQDVQREYKYLPERVLAYIADRLNISEAKIYGVATFYENFSLCPKGKYVIKVCNGTACHVRESITILEELRRILKVDEKNITTKDMMFTVETVSCLGACGLAPVCTVNDVVYPNMTKEKIRKLIKDLKEEKPYEN